jgi:hypothetical protein
MRLIRNIQTIVPPSTFSRRKKEKKKSSEHIDTRNRSPTHDLRRHFLENDEK